MIGQQWAPRTHELRDLLHRNNLPYGFIQHDSRLGADLLKELGHGEASLPVLLLDDGTVLANPENVAIADALGASIRVEKDLFDVIVVSAGPSGLAAAVYGASEGLKTIVIEREAMGGQAGTSSRIRNYLGFPMGISGGELAQRAYSQARLFGAPLDFGRSAVGPAAALFVLIGAFPHTEWLADNVRRDGAGFILTGADLSSATGGMNAQPATLLETSMPGVFAVGRRTPRFHQTGRFCCRRRLSRHYFGPFVPDCRC